MKMSKILNNLDQILETYIEKLKNAERSVKIYTLEEEDNLFHRTILTFYKIEFSIIRIEAVSQLILTKSLQNRHFRKKY